MAKAISHHATALTKIIENSSCYERVSYNCSVTESIQDILWKASVLFQNKTMFPWVHLDANSPKRSECVVYME